MKRLSALLLAVGFVVFSSAAHAQQFVTNMGKNTGAVASITNPLPSEIDVSGSAISASNPLPAQISQGNAVISVTNPVPVIISNGTNYASASAPQLVQLSNGTVAIDATHGTYANLLQGNAVISLSNPLFAQISADGTNAVNSTHGLYSNLLQGNAVISTTNGLYSNLLQGNAVLSATNGTFANLLQGNAVLSATNPIFIAPSGVAAASIVNTTTSIPNTDTAVALGISAKRIKIQLSSGSAIMYVDFANGTATSGDYAIPAGGSVDYEGSAITSIHVLGASASGTYSILAY